MIRSLFLASTITCISLLISCSNNEGSTPEVKIISATLNGSNVSDAATDIPISAVVTLTFSAAISPDDFDAAFSFSAGGVDVEVAEISYASASSRVSIALELDYNTSYELRIASDVAIGADGQVLAEPYSLTLDTQEDETITSVAPCTNGEDCKSSVSLQVDESELTLEFYSNYPIYLENARWENLTSAIILIHGVNRNSDDYFEWMNTTLSVIDVDENTILITPSFKIESEAETNELYWDGSGWREGEDAVNAAISSFAVIDSIISQLANADLFPVLDQIIITGHSSGGLFTHTYGAAGQAEINHTALSFQYVVANSQFFYYPDGNRINEANDQLYTPSSCALYTDWPYGAESTPDYVSALTNEELNDQFVSRSITYLLGNGDDPDPSLNTTSCSATLLGSTRFSRGENMFQYMELSYPGTHNHTKAIVEGIGHDGQGMYQSDEFETLLGDLLQ